MAPLFTASAAANAPKTANPIRFIVQVPEPWRPSYPYLARMVNGSALIITEASEV